MIHHNKKFLFIFPFQSLSTQNFIKNIIGVNKLSQMTIFIPSQLITLKSYRCCFVGFNLNGCNNSLIFLTFPNEFLTPCPIQDNDIKIINDEYYTFPGTLNFLTDVSGFSRYKTIFQSFRGKDHFIKSIETYINFFYTIYQKNFLYATTISFRYK